MFLSIESLCKAMEPSSTPDGKSGTSGSVGQSKLPQRQAVGEKSIPRQPSSSLTRLQDKVGAGSAKSTTPTAPKMRAANSQRQVKTSSMKEGELPKVCTRGCLALKDRISSCHLVSFLYLICIAPNNGLAAFHASHDVRSQYSRACWFAN